MTVVTTTSSCDSGVDCSQYTSLRQPDLLFPRPRADLTNGHLRHGEDEENPLFFLHKNHQSQIIQSTNMNYYVIVFFWIIWLFVKYLLSGLINPRRPNHHHHHHYHRHLSSYWTFSSMPRLSFQVGKHWSVSWKKSSV